MDECNDECFDLDVTDDHCGTCGTVCPATQQCSGGECLRSPCDKLCSSPGGFTLDGTGYRVNNLGTGARCLEQLDYAPTETDARIVSWEFQGGRSLRVNGVQVATNTSIDLGPPRAGGYCVQVGGGGASFAGLLLPLVSE